MKYKLKNDGIYYPGQSVEHNNMDYDEKGFLTLFEMQKNHFWYIGRHKFLEHKLQNVFNLNPIKGSPLGHKPLKVIDIGGGVGGWVRYLSRSRLRNEMSISLADSSPFALAMAKKMMDSNKKLYCVDLMNLGMSNEWDAIFMLDVIEHIHDDEKALAQVYEALRPGGHVFITAPALNFFWSANDEHTGHYRRYNKADFQKLADAVGYELVDASYFMFF